MIKRQREANRKCSGGLLTAIRRPEGGTRPVADGVGTPDGRRPIIAAPKRGAQAKAFPSGEGVAAR